MSFVLLKIMKPFKETSKGTISSWIKNLLGLAGIDTKLTLDGSDSISYSSQKVSIEILLEERAWRSFKTSENF